MFAIYGRFYRFSLESLKSIADHVRDFADDLSEGINQILHDLSGHPLISSKRSTQLKRANAEITPASLLLFDGLLLCLCFIYLAIFHPQLMQLSPSVWTNTILYPTNFSFLLLISVLIIDAHFLVLTLVISSVVSLITLAALPVLVSISMLFAPELLWQGIDQMPSSIRLWVAISSLILAVVYFLPLISADSILQ